MGGIARANAPNTLYAHVWNVGKAPAFGVRVEFYWFNPSLGISRADANLIVSSGLIWVIVLTIILIGAKLSCRKEVI